MIRKYYADTLKETKYLGFDWRIWSLQAQDKEFWRQLVRGATFDKSTHGGSPQGPSSATISMRRRADRLEALGETETVVGSTGTRSVSSRCLLRCGWKKECNVTKHIVSTHTLRPVTFRCAGCDQRFTTKTLMNNHLRDDAHSITEIRKGDKYKWDDKHGFLAACLPTGHGTDGRQKQYTVP